MTQRKDGIHNSQFTIHNSQLAPHPHHPLAWVTWLAGVLVALTTTRNPWYIALVLAMIALVLAVQGKRQEENAALAAPVISPLKFALITVSFSALFNAAMVHIGTTVLFTLPAAIPLIGGPVTLEALVYGALNGLVLAGLFAAFTVINRVLSVRAALRLVPRAYYPVAVVLSIAVTFVPTTLHQIQQIREAQAVRGHRLRGARSWLPLVIPLLEGGLERSMQLAEAMMARGFASAEQHADARPRLILLVGLAGLVGGWLLQLVWKLQVIGDTSAAGKYGVSRCRPVAGRTAAPPHGLPTRCMAWSRLGCDRWRRRHYGCLSVALVRPGSFVDFLLSVSNAELAGIQPSDRCGDIGIDCAGAGLM